MSSMTMEVMDLTEAVNWLEIPASSDRLNMRAVDGVSGEGVKTAKCLSMQDSVAMSLEPFWQALLPSQMVMEIADILNIINEKCQRIQRQKRNPSPYCLNCE
ncbi:hypothetical protein BsWGS_06013 [Bradybaena similaris]